MKVRELQEMLNKIQNKDASIEFNFTKFDDDNEDHYVDLNLQFIQDDSYHEDPNIRCVYFGFYDTPQLEFNPNVDEETIMALDEKVKNTPVKFYEG